MGREGLEFLDFTSNFWGGGVLSPYWLTLSPSHWAIPAFPDLGLGNCS